MRENIGSVNQGFLGSMQGVYVTMERKQCTKEKILTLLYATKS